MTHTPGSGRRRLINLTALAVLASPIALGAQTHVPSQLKAVRLRPAGDSIQVAFVLSGSIRYKAIRVADPSRITIDFGRTGISPVLTKREYLSVHAALVRVLITRTAAGTRAVLDLAQAGAHSIYTSGDQLIVDIKTGTMASAMPKRPQPLVSTPLSARDVEVPQAASRTLEIGTMTSAATVRVPWVALGPTIDGIVGSEPKPAAARVSEFRQREPGDGTPASEETTAYLSYDNEYLYVIFVCRDLPGDVRGHLVAREAIGEDDQVALYLDTFHDGRHAFVFASNPLGVQQDGVVSDSDDPNYTADMVWRSEGRVTNDGFVVLMAIPFKTLRFSADSIQNWRVALSRTIARRGETVFWPYITRRVNGFVQQMAPLEGLELISPGRNVQLTPYGTFARADSFDPTARGNVRFESRRAGFDSKVVVKNAVAIDAAVNPDFSEVESDDPLIAVNQRFELFLPEKRPFFMENASLFETPIKVFFSRRVGDPDVGVRVTGRSTGWAMGALLADDRAVPPAEAGGLFGQGATSGVVRVQRQFGERSNLGVLATERDDAAERNHVISADTRLQLSPSWSFSGQAMFSHDSQQNTGRQRGVAYSAALARTGAHFYYVGSYRDIDSAIRVPLGFVPRLDIRATEQYAGYIWRVGDGQSWSLGPSASVALDADHSGQVQDRLANADFGISRSGQLDFHVARARAYERYVTIPFQRETTNVSFSSGALSWLSLWALYSWGTAINYTSPAGVTPFLGERHGAYGGVTFRPSTRLRVEEMLLHEQLDTLPGAAVNPTKGVFSTTLVRLKANLQITRALAIRGIGDYNQLDANPTLFSQTGASHLMGDVLVRYVVNPGTAIYVGVNHRYENLIVGPRPDDVTQHGGIPTFPVGQQIFVKVSYLFQL